MEENADIIYLVEDYYGINRKEAAEKSNDFVENEYFYLSFDITKLLPDAELIAIHTHDAVGYHNREGNASGAFIYKYEDIFIVYSFCITGSEEKSFHVISYNDEKEAKFYENHFEFYGNIDPVLFLDHHKHAKYNLKFVRDLFFYFSTEEKLMKYIIELD